MSRKGKYLFQTGLILAGMLSIATVRGERPARADEDDAPVTTRTRKGVSRAERGELEDALRRAWKWAREIDDPKIMRAGVVTDIDDGAAPAVVVAFEFDNGSLGLYLGSRATADRDSHIYLSKTNLPWLEETIHSSRSR